MKKFYTLIILLGTFSAAFAQTLNVQVGNVTYLFPASQAGQMPYSGGTTLTAMGKSFTLSEVDSMWVDETTVTDSLVTVAYTTSSAAITVAGNIAQYLTIAQSGAHVSITQSDDLATEVTYQLSGTSTDGEFYMAGSYKATLELNGLTLTNATPVYSGAAVHIENGKRIDVKVISGTESTLKDASSGSQKGALYIKGHAEFKQKGTLNVYGYKKHGIKTGDYCTIKKATINVPYAVGDGLNCTQYFLIESGSLNISGALDDGIQADIDDTTTGSTGETTDHEDEDTGNIYLNGGTIVISSSATAAKAIKAEGNIKATAGTYTITTSGNGEWDDDDAETKAACGLAADANIYISGGTFTITATGSGGKGIKCDTALVISDSAYVSVTTTGGLYYNNGSTENTNYTGSTDNISSNYYSSPKAIKAGTKTESGSSYTYAGDLQITGGTVIVSTSGYNAEGIESKNTMTISGGTVTVNSYDDGLNSAQNMYLKGGTVTVIAKNNDGIDSNGNMYISGGTVMAFGASGAECGLDVAEGKSLYITGGNVLAAGGSNNSVSSTTGSQCLLSPSISLSANSTVAVKSGSSTLASFTIPSDYSSSSSGGMNFMPAGGPGGGGGPGGSSTSTSTVLISCAGMTSGTSYTVTYGSSSTTATASTTYSGM